MRRCALVLILLFVCTSVPCHAGTMVLSTNATPEDTDVYDIESALFTVKDGQAVFLVQGTQVLRDPTDPDVILAVGGVHLFFSIPAMQTTVEYIPLAVVVRNFEALPYTYIASGVRGFTIVKQDSNTYSLSGTLSYKCRWFDYAGAFMQNILFSPDVDATFAPDFFQSKEYRYLEIVTGMSNYETAHPGGYKGKTP